MTKDKKALARAVAKNLIKNGRKIHGDIKTATSDEKKADYKDSGIAVGSAVELVTLNGEDAINPV